MSEDKKLADLKNQPSTARGIPTNVDGKTGGIWDTSSAITAKAKLYTEAIERAEASKGDELLEKISFLENFILENVSTASPETLKKVQQAVEVIKSLRTSFTKEPEQTVQDPRHAILKMPRKEDIKNVKEGGM